MSGGFGTNFAVLYILIVVVVVVGVFFGSVGGYGGSRY